MPSLLFGGSTTRPAAFRGRTEKIRRKKEIRSEQIRSDYVCICEGTIGHNVLTFFYSLTTVLPIQHT